MTHIKKNNSCAHVLVRTENDCVFFLFAVHCTSLLLQCIALSFHPFSIFRFKLVVFFIYLHRIRSFYPALKNTNVRWNGIKRLKKIYKKKEIRICMWKENRKCVPMKNWDNDIQYLSVASSGTTPDIPRTNIWHTGKRMRPRDGIFNINIHTANKYLFVAASFFFLAKESKFQGNIDQWNHEMCTVQWISRQLTLNATIKKWKRACNKINRRRDWIRDKSWNGKSDGREEIERGKRLRKRVRCERESLAWA